MEDFLNQIQIRTSLKTLIGHEVKLTMRGREAVGLCPFHHEKTPSFHVVEDKNFYHCFGCGKNGDAINWLMERRGLTFRDAVQELAKDAGLTVPERFFGQAQKNISNDLYSVLELAAQYFDHCLDSPKGAMARQYLKQRQITAAIRKKFRLGFAPDSDSFDDFIEFMQARHVTIEQLQKSGLIAFSENTQSGENHVRTHKRREGPYAHFRARLMFPILDKQSRVIGFGGRTLTGHRAKYINSPQTDVFHKGFELYHQNIAYPEVRKGKKLIVAEGYMDVIRLAAHGFLGAVAPLGTAISEMQLMRLWQAAPAPYLCFDGDPAGIMAAYRAGLRALPRLAPGKSLQFCFLPPQHDPDSFLQEQGSKAFEQYLQKSLPLAEMLFAAELEKFTLHTPESRAGFENQLMQHAQSIEDNIVSRHYRSFFKQMLWQKLQRKKSAHHSILTPLISRQLTPEEDSFRRYQAVCLGLFYHPVLYAPFEERLAMHGETPCAQTLFAELADAVSKKNHETWRQDNFHHHCPALAALVADKNLLHLFPGLKPSQEAEQAEKTIQHIFKQLDFYQLQREKTHAGFSAEKQEQLRCQTDSAWQQAFDEDIDELTD